MTFNEAMEHAARTYLQARLTETGGNVRRAALAAGMHRSHFYRVWGRLKMGKGPRPLKPRSTLPSMTSLPRIEGDWR